MKWVRRGRWAIGSMGLAKGGRSEGKGGVLRPREPGVQGSSLAAATAPRRLQNHEEEESANGELTVATTAQHLIPTP